ncbi:MAG: hypothetical protein JWP57_3665, partial [Spirosoma sp.]|nr:hypothetical protein [Spirosoma sp.]
LIGLYVLCIETITHRSVKPIVGVVGLVLAVFLYTYSYREHLIKVEDRTTNLTFSTAFYNDNPANLIVYWGDPTLGKLIFQDALKKDIYQVPKTTFSDLKSSPIPLDNAPPAPTNDVTSDVKPYPIHDYLVMYQSWAVNGQPSNETQIQVVAQSPQNSYAFDTRRQVRYDVVNQYQYLQAGFSCVIKKGDLRPGHYTLGVRLVSKGIQSYVPLTSSFDV